MCGSSSPVWRVEECDYTGEELTHVCHCTVVFVACFVILALLTCILFVERDTGVPEIVIVYIEIYKLLQTFIDKPLILHPLRLLCWRAVNAKQAKLCIALSLAYSCYGLEQYMAATG